MSVNETGFRPEFFRPFDSYCYPSSSLYAGVYRLYGLRFDTDIFVAGGGGAKFVRKIQDDAILNNALFDVQQAAKALIKRMKRRGLNHPPRDLNGLMHLPEDLLKDPLIADQ